MPHQFPAFLLAPRLTRITKLDGAIERGDVRYAISLAEELRIANRLLVDNLQNPKYVGKASRTAAPRSLSRWGKDRALNQCLGLVHAHLSEREGWRMTDNRFAILSSSAKEIAYRTSP